MLPGLLRRSLPAVMICVAAGSLEGQVQGSAQVPITQAAKLAHGDVMLEAIIDPITYAIRH